MSQASRYKQAIATRTRLAAGVLVEPAWKTDPDAMWYGRTPLPKQREFVDRFRVGGMTEGFYGGAYGGGKTVALSFLAAWGVTSFPGIRILLGRLHKSSLEKTTLPEFEAMANGLRDRYGLEYRYYYSTNIMAFEFFQDDDKRWCSRIDLVELKDPRKIQGASADWALLDEGSEVGAAAWRQIAARVRGSTYNEGDGRGGRKWPVLTAATGNPLPGYAHRNFVQPHERGELGKPPFEKRFYIPSGSADNPYNEEGYVDRMKLAGVHENLIVGVWDFSDGNVFQAPMEAFAEIDELAITGRPKGFNPREAGYDYGKLHEAAWVAGFVHDGTLYVTDEFIKSGMQIEEGADWAKKVGVEAAYADRTTVWQRRQTGDNTNECVATLYQREGVTLTPANTGASANVFQGVRLVREMLHRGALVIDPKRCPKLAEAVRTYSHESNDAGEYDPREFSEELKDRIDALRYLVLNVEPRLTYKDRREEEGEEGGAAKTGAARREAGGRPGLWERARMEVDAAETDAMCGRDFLVGLTSFADALPDDPRLDMEHEFADWQQ